MDNILYFNKLVCNNNYWEIIFLAINTFRTEEKWEIKGLITEFRVDLKFDKVFEICYVFVF